VLATAIPVYADPADPDSMDIYAIYANRNLLETGDMLIVFHYDIAYTVLPTEAANQNFIFRLIDTDGTTELGAVRPYPYEDLGYNQGCSSFYFDADDAPTWGETYTIQIAGNPVKFTVPPVENFTIATSDYTSSTDQDDNQSELAGHILDIAADLEVAWTATLTDAGDTGTVLYGAGETYFRSAVIGLQGVAPSLFIVQVGDPDYTRQSWGTNQATTYEARYNGTWIQAGINAVAGLFHLSDISLSSIIVLIAVVALVILSSYYVQTPIPGLRASFCAIFCGGVMGWLGMEIVAVITILCGLYLGYWWFFARS
jgi:hypothetical protein